MDTKKRNVVTENSAFQYFDATDVQSDALVVPAAVTFTYNHARDDRVLDYKARFSYPGKLLVPGIHYNLEDLSVYVAVRDAVRLLLSIRARLGLTPHHLESKSRSYMKTNQDRGNSI